MALAMELQPGAPDAAAAAAAIESSGSRRVPRVGHGSLDLITTPTALFTQGLSQQTVRAPV